MTWNENWEWVYVVRECSSNTDVKGSHPHIPPVLPTLFQYNITLLLISLSCSTLMIGDIPLCACKEHTPWFLPAHFIKPGCVLTVRGQERDPPVEKRGVCQVCVVYFWATTGCLFTLDWLKKSSENCRASSTANIRIPVRAALFLALPLTVWMHAIPTFFLLSPYTPSIPTPTLPAPPLCLSTHGITGSPWGWIGNEESRSRPVGKSQT